jgi:hypothetical protein
VTVDPEYVGKENLVLLIRVHKLLRSELEKDLVPYLKAKEGKTSVVAEVQKTVSNMCASRRPWEHRQSFVWAARPLFTQVGTRANKPVFNVIEESKADLYSYAKGFNDRDVYPLVEAALATGKTRATSSLRVVPGFVSIRASNVTGSLPAGRVNPSGIALDKATDAPVVKEALEFGLVPQPVLQYQNLLYVYPDATITAKLKDPNILCVASYVPDPDSPDPESPCKFYGPYGMQWRTAEATSTIVYKDKHPQFYDEWKFALPAVLSTKACIKFTFYHVEVSGKLPFYKRKAWAYGCMPLWRGDAPIRDGEHVLTLMTDKVEMDPPPVRDSELSPAQLAASGYRVDSRAGSRFGGSTTNSRSSTHAGTDSARNDSDDEFDDDGYAYGTGAAATGAADDDGGDDTRGDSGESLSTASPSLTLRGGTKTIRGSRGTSSSRGEGGLQKMQFTVRTRLASTVMTHDKNLIRFFREGTRKLSLVRKVNPETCLQYYPALLARLLDILCSEEARENRPLQTEAFLALVYVIEQVDRTARIKLKNTRTATLVAWQRYMFDNAVDSAAVSSTKDDGFVYMELTRVWLEAKQAGVIGEFKLSWLFFDLICKSIILRVAANKRLDARNRSKWVSPEFKEALLTLAREHFRTSEHVVLHSFFRNLLNVIDRTLAFTIIGEYIEFLGTHGGDRGFTQRADLLKTLLQHPDFVAINYPVDIRASECDVDNLSQSFGSRHFLVGRLLAEVSRALDSEASSRVQAIFTLRDFVQKHDNDPRFADPATRAYLGDLYFPVVALVAAKAPIVSKTVSEAERKSLFNCMLFALANCHRRLYRDWFVGETTARRDGLFSVLAVALATAKRTADSAGGSGGSRIGSSAPAAGAGAATRGSVSPAHNWLALCYVVVELIAYAIDDAAEELAAEGAKLFGLVLDLIDRLAEQKDPAFFALLCRVLHQLVLSQRQAIFGHTGTSYCERLVIHFLAWCKSEDPLVVSRARSLYYWLVRGSFETVHNFHKVKLVSIVAVSTLLGGSGQHEGSSATSTSASSTEAAAVRTASPTAVGTATSQSFARLTASLEAVSQHAEQEPIVEFLDELRAKVETLISHQSKIAAAEPDPELLADLYYSISQGYADSPDLRVAWLDNLASKHQEAGDMAEGAQAKLMQMALVLEHLERTGEAPIALGALKEVAPNFQTEARLPPANTVGALESTVWSRESVVKLFKDAIALLLEDGDYEESLSLYHVLIAVYKAESNYSEMIKALAEYKSTCETLVQEAAKFDRPVPYYYRVGYYGAGWPPELAGNEFIYKVSAAFTLGNFLNKLKSQFVATGVVKDGAEIDFLTTNKQVDAAALQADGKLHIQVGAVKPYIGKPTTAAGALSTGNASHVNEFVFEAAHADDGGKGAIREDDFSKQLKRKVIFTTEHTFPYVKKRVHVTGRREIILNAADNALELMISRVQMLRKEMAFNPPRLNSLQQIIQGSVVPLVNGGPVQFARVFVVEDHKDMDNEKRRLFADVLKEFLRLNGFAIALLGSIITEKHKKFQAMVMKYYKQLKTELNGLIDDGEAKWKF